MLVDIGNVASSGLIATLPADGGAYHNTKVLATCHMGISVNTSGAFYNIDATGNLANDFQGTWRTSGASNQYWVRATLSVGTLDYIDAGSSYVSCDTTRSWGGKRTTSGTDNLTILIEIATDSGGTNVVASVSYTPVAFYDNLD